MKQVLLIDDEPLVLESIHAGVDWDALGAEVCAQCIDPMEAMNYVRHSPVDVVITDITMPTMNGLVLCAQIQQIAPQVQFIIISGHADFAYAQKAMQFGCIGYCLKPVDYGELTDYLRKAIGYRPPSDMPYEFIESLYENNLEQIRRFLEQQELREPFYAAVSVGQDSLRDLLGGFCCSTGLNEHLYLSGRSFADEITPEVLEGRRLLGVALRAEPVDCDHLRETAFQLMYDSRQYFFYPDQRLFPEPCVYLEGLLEEARHFPRQPKELERRLRELKGRFSHIQQAAELYNLLYQQAGGEGNIYTYYQLAFAYRDYDAMVESLLELTGEAETIPSGSGNKSFLNIIKYIHENYTQDISVQSLADQFYMNPCYVSQLFKKETGETFVKYLTGLRMNRAEELLRSTDWPVKRISEECGFNDPFYFIKAFKKFAGQTPSTYRKEARV